MFSANTSQVAAGGGAVFVEDIFSTYLYTGNGSGQIIQNGINLGAGNTGGSGYFDGTGDSLRAPSNSAFTFGTGDYTIEAWVYAQDYANNVIVEAGAFFGLYTGFLAYYESNGGFISSSIPVSLNTWTHVALSRSSGTLKLFVNGAVGASTSVTTNLTSTTCAISYGAIYGGPAFNGYISNVRIVKGTAVYTSAFTPSTTPLTAVSGTSLLTCQGTTPFVDNSTNAFTLTVFGNTSASVLGPFTSATAGAGGMVWLKARNQAYQHGLFDTARGASKGLVSNTTDAEATFTSLTSFNTDGFSLGGDYNGGATYASWTFREQPKFFDVLTYTGDGAVSRNIAHNLGSEVGSIFLKRTSGASSSWSVYHRSLGTGKFLQLNTTGAVLTDADTFASVTSTTFSVSSNTNQNDNGATYVAYLFAHNAGGFGLTGTDNVISCGSATIDGGGQATVNLGYEPQWILYKSSTNVQNWYIYDVMRGMPVGTTSGPYSSALSPNATTAEFLGASFAITSTGFNIQTSIAGATYIYVAIRRGPMAVPTSGTSVYEGTTRTGTGAAASISGLSFPPDAVLTRNRDSNGSSRYAFYDKLRGPTIYLDTAATDSEFTNAQSLTTFNQTGESFGTGAISNYSGDPYINWQFRRAPSFFDEVCYTGDGTADGRTFTHNLGATPQLVIVKRRSSTSDWVVMFNTDHAMLLNSTNADTGYIGATGNYANGILIGTNATTLTEYSGASGNSAVNASGSTYVAYLFATCAGVSKVGSYTGTATTKQIDCGFTAGARFVLIKRTDSTGDWYVWDSARGIVSGNDPYLLLNSTAAEVTGTDYVDTYSAGFEISSTAPAAINASGGSFIFLAIA